jgi:membrane protease YdiL (CAAX protease family)
MTIFLFYYDPGKLFYILKEKPEIIPFLMVFYPVFSALPQEFIFCTFFFERYKSFFPTTQARIIASAIVFAYAHVLFINPVAPALSFIAGLIFAGTFAKTKSLALVTIEHSLYGVALFIIGLGWYFWGGALI